MNQKKVQMTRCVRNYRRHRVVAVKRCEGVGVDVSTGRRLIIAGFELKENID
jgi:hypothetical protein